MTGRTACCKMFAISSKVFRCAEVAGDSGEYECICASQRGGRMHPRLRLALEFRLVRPSGVDRLIARHISVGVEKVGGDPFVSLDRAEARIMFALVVVDAVIVFMLNGCHDSSFLVGTTIETHPHCERSASMRSFLVMSIDPRRRDPALRPSSCGPGRRCRRSSERSTPPVRLAGCRFTHHEVFEQLRARARRW